MKRTAACLAKLDRVNKALRHEEPDRVPVSDFFWGSFLERWRTEKGLPDDTDIYRHYDLDWVVTTPNMDPHIKPFETLKETDYEVVVRTGFEAVVRKKFADPMPEFVSFETDTIEKAEGFEFDDPWDDRRFFGRGRQPDRRGRRRLCPGFPSLDRDREGAVPRHPGLREPVRSQRVYDPHGRSGKPAALGRPVPGEIRPVRGAHQRLRTGMPQGSDRGGERAVGRDRHLGDIAYTKDMFFSPDYWRRYYKPGLKAMVDTCHENDLPVIYHGCGNVRRVFEDFIEIGVDAYNPLEAKAGLDVVELRRRYGHRIGFCGNMNVIEWAHCSREELKAIVLRKLNAAKGGGLIFQSDHSVPGNVSAESYEYVVSLVREYGRYPLELGEYDVPDLT